MPRSPAHGLLTLEVNALQLGSFRAQQREASLQASSPISILLPGSKIAKQSSPSLTLLLLSLGLHMS
jgi:hypothetical protein